jgi:SpoIIAA-like
MSDGFHSEHIDGVTLHTFSDSSDEAVAAWAAALDQVMASSRPDHPFRVLIDVSSKQVSFTRLARQHSLNLFTRHRQRTGRAAFLFSSRTAPYYSRIFFASLGRLAFELNTFHNREKALEWLKRD